MTLPRARVVKRDGATAVAALLAPGPSVPQKRRVARGELEARLSAEAFVEDAKLQAQVMIDEAKATAQRVAEDARAEARQEADRTLVARWLALRDAEARRSATDADRIIPVAVVIAERLVGAALELDPSRIATLAAGVMAEARGARRATLHAHPDDADALRHQLVDGGLDAGSVDVRSDPALARGALRLQTDVGIIDAQLAPRLERLAQALRDALR